ncbi:hypothetical protein KSF_001270 [Reticulibacter mediterranei]|uniref:Uncharacterized protein n=1 Tax=Reticulibacter mediterranei TaxID=2778369 RepID=A0A8J3IF71_9CHLR|nr:hypothetical protein KSF_001270 [Reticulibacter mediterranei]
MWILVIKQLPDLHEEIILASWLHPQETPQNPDTHRSLHKRYALASIEEWGGNVYEVCHTWLLNLLSSLYAIRSLLVSRPMAVT